MNNRDVMQKEKIYKGIKVDRDETIEIDYSNEKMETEFTFENFDFPKSEAYKKNNEYYKKLRGKNDYKGEFFIQYLFEPNLKKFSDVKMAINYQEFKDYSDKAINEFNNLKTGVEPLYLMSQLKWLS